MERKEESTLLEQVSETDRYKIKGGGGGGTPEAFRYRMQDTPGPHSAHPDGNEDDH